MRKVEGAEGKGHSAESITHRAEELEVGMQVADFIKG